MLQQGQPMLANMLATFEYVLRSLSTKKADENANAER